MRGLKGFSYHYYHRQLLDYTIQTYFPELGSMEDNKVCPSLPPPPPPPLPSLQKLISSTLPPSFPPCPQTEQYLAFYSEVVKKTAALVAHWQSVGFTHGVLNTDNMSVLGLTIGTCPPSLPPSLRPSVPPSLHWQSVGFTHGVLNTDSMSVLGLTIGTCPPSLPPSPQTSSTTAT